MLKIIPMSLKIYFWNQNSKWNKLGTGILRNYTIHTFNNHLTKQCTHNKWCTREGRKLRHLDIWGQKTTKISPNSPPLAILSQNQLNISQNQLKISPIQSKFNQNKAKFVAGKFFMGQNIGLVQTRVWQKIDPSTIILICELNLTILGGISWVFYQVPQDLPSWCSLWSFKPYIQWRGITHILILLAQFVCRKLSSMPSCVLRQRGLNVRGIANTHQNISFCLIQ